MVLIAANRSIAGRVRGVCEALGEVDEFTGDQIMSSSHKSYTVNCDKISCSFIYFCNINGSKLPENVAT